MEGKTDYPICFFPTANPIPGIEELQSISGQQAELAPDRSPVYHRDSGTNQNLISKVIEDIMAGGACTHLRDGAGTSVPISSLPRRR